MEEKRLVKFPFALVEARAHCRTILREYKPEDHASGDPIVRANAEHLLSELRKLHHMHPDELIRWASQYATMDADYRGHSSEG